MITILRGGSPAGTYSDLQTAINASQNGDTLQLAAGTYAGNVEITKEISIEGPNTGVAGGDDERVAEAHIAGNVLITANNVTIDGVEFSDGTVDKRATKQSGMERVLIKIEGDNVTVENSDVYVGARQNGDSQNGVQITGDNAVFDSNLVERVIVVSHQLSSTSNPLVRMNKGANLTITNNTLEGGNIGGYVDSSNSEVLITGNEINPFSDSNEAFWVVVSDGAEQFFLNQEENLEGNTRDGEDLIFAHINDAGNVMRLSEGQEPLFGNPANSALVYGPNTGPLGPENDTVNVTYWDENGNQSTLQYAMDRDSDIVTIGLAVDGDPWDEQTHDLSWQNAAGAVIAVDDSTDSYDQTSGIWTVTGGQDDVLIVTAEGEDSGSYSATVQSDVGLGAQLSVTLANGAIRVDGTELAESIITTDRDDTIVSGGGNDTINSGAGEDDVFLGGNGGHHIVGNGNELDGDTFYDLHSRDTIRFTDLEFDADDIDFVSAIGYLGVDLDGGGDDLVMTIDWQDLVDQSDALQLRVANFRGDTIIFVDVALPDLSDGIEVSEQLAFTDGDLYHLTGDGSHDFTITLSELGTAQLDNVLGVYEIAEDGSISNVQILFEHTNAQKGTSVTINDVTDGAQLGFFVISGGAELVAGMTGSEALTITQVSGTAGNAYGDDALHLSIDGVVSDAFIFHSAGTALNADGVAHAISGTIGDSDETVIGFEDQFGGGDRDYEDVVISITTPSAFVDDTPV